MVSNIFTGFDHVIPISYDLERYINFLPASSVSNRTYNIPLSEKKIVVVDDDDEFERVLEEYESLFDVE